MSLGLYGGTGQRTLVTLKVLWEKTVQEWPVERLWVLWAALFLGALLATLNIFYKTSCYYSQIETCLIYSRFLCKKCHRTLSRQADCNSRLRSVTCNSTRGEEFLPVPLTWISNIKWNGCSIPLGKTKTKLFNRWIFFPPHWSFLQSTYFLSLLGLSMYSRIFFLLSERIAGCPISTRNRRFLNSWDPEEWEIGLFNRRLTRCFEQSQIETLLAQ